MEQPKKFIHCEIPPKLYERLDKALPKGTKTLVVNTLLEALADMVEGPDGRAYLGLLIQGEVNTKQLLALANIAKVS